MKADDYLYKAAGEMADRAKSRDNPGGERSMGRCVNGFNALFGEMIRERINAGLDPLDEVLGWEFMSVLKKARKAAGAYREDDYVDDVAYPALSAEAAAREYDDQQHEPFKIIGTRTQEPQRYTPPATRFEGMARIKEPDSD